MDLFGGAIDLHTILYEDRAILQQLRSSKIKQLEKQQEESEKAGKQLGSGQKRTTTI